jgi:hypothetical protein
MICAHSALKELSSIQKLKNALLARKAVKFAITQVHAFSVLMVLLLKENAYNVELTALNVMLINAINVMIGFT